MMDKPIIICLTPVKNEAWILERFLKCASLWADYIIISDQMSTDGSREIAMKYSKVMLIDNSNIGEFNEFNMRNILFQQGRLITGDKIFIVLDADEVLSGNFLNSEEWHKIMNAKKGDYFSLDLVNIRPDFKQYWQATGFKRIYIDDGTEYTADIIHTAHIPIPKNGVNQILTDIKILHYQYTDWQRMQSKHRWYQCFEMINRPHLHPITIFRIYHHMYAIAKKELQELPDEWFDFYEEKGIDMRSINVEKVYHWDKQVEQYFEKYGTKQFALINIWQNPTGKFPDPRNIPQKLLHRYLLWSHVFYYQKFPVNTTVRAIDKCLKWLF